MMKWLMIASLTVTLLGCGDDALVGKWEGTDDSDVDLDVQSGDSGFLGEGHIYLCWDDDCYLCPFDFEASERSDDEYDVEGEFTGDCRDAGAFEDVRCTLLSDTRLQCETPDGLDIDYDKVE